MGVLRIVAVFRSLLFIHIINYTQTQNPTSNQSNHKNNEYKRKQAVNKKYLIISLNTNHYVSVVGHHPPQFYFSFDQYS